MKIQEGDTLVIYEKESKIRVEVLVTEVTAKGVVGPYTMNGRNFAEGSFPFNEYIFPGDKDEATELLCELVKFHQRNVYHDLTADEQMLFSRAEKLAATFEPEIAAEEPVTV